MNSYYINSRQTPGIELESMFPDVYKELYPFVLEAVNDLTRRDYSVTPEMITAMVDNIIKASGLWDEDSDPVQSANMPQFRRPRRRHHNRNSLRDVLRILLLRELIEKR